jgi:hypothetical protein
MHRWPGLDRHLLPTLARVSAGVLLGMALATACYDPEDPAIGGAACPTDDDDNGCEVCAKQNCCEELTTCQADPDCDCISDCTVQRGSAALDTCRTICMAAEPQPELDALGVCATEADCTAACE